MDAAAVLDGAAGADTKGRASGVEQALLHNAAFLIANDCKAKGTGELKSLGSVEYHHILGSWSPSARLANAKGTWELSTSII